MHTLQFMKKMCKYDSRMVRTNANIWMTIKAFHIHHLSCDYQLITKKIIIKIVINDVTLNAVIGVNFQRYKKGHYDKNHWDFFHLIVSK